MVSAPLHVILKNTSDPRTLRTAVVTNPGLAGEWVIEVDVDAQGGIISVLFLGGTKANERPVVGDVVLLQRTAGTLVCVGVVGSNVAVPEIPDPDDPATNPPPPDPTFTTVTLSPRATGTARSGSVRGDTTQLYQGDWTGRGWNSGQATYSANHLSGTVTRAVLSMRRLDAGSYSGQAPTMRIMAQGSLTGTPTWQDVATGPTMKVNQSASWVMPTIWGQSLVDGSSGGLGIHVDSSSPYIRLAGKNDGAMKLTLTVRSD